MTGYTPEQMPVVSALARGFATFDHWFCEVPSQTFANRSFFHAGTSSGYVVNMSPADSFPVHNTAETIFERLESKGLTWRVYCDPPSRISFTGIIHAPRLLDRFATNFFTTDQFLEDAANGDLPTYSFIEPNMLYGHNDMHPAFDALFPGIDARPAVRPCSEARRCWRRSTTRSAPRRRLAGRTPTTPCSWSTSTSTAALTTMSRRPRSCRPTRPRPPARWASLSTGRACACRPSPSPPGYRSGPSINEEYRNTSVIRTMRERWQLGAPLTARDAVARDIAPVLSLDSPAAAGGLARGLPAAGAAVRPGPDLA